MLHHEAPHFVQELRDLLDFVDEDDGGLLFAVG